MLPDNSVRNIESQTGAFSDRFGCEERIEQLREMLFRDASARVRNANKRVVCVGVGCDSHDALAFDGLGGINDQVQEYLIPFPGKATYTRQIAELLLHLALVFQFVPNHFQSRFEAFIDIRKLDF